MATETEILEGTTRTNPETQKQEFYNPFGQWQEVTDSQQLLGSEPAKPATIITADEAIKETKGNVNWIEEEERIRKEIAEKQYQVEQLQPQLEEAKKREAKDIDLYKGKESIRVSSANAADYIDQGWQQSPTEEYLQATGEGEEGEIIAPKTEEQKLIEEQQKKADELDAQTKDIQDQLDLAKANSDAITQGIIIGLQDSYTAQANLQKEINRRAEETMRTMGIRFGTERYSPQLAGDIVNAQERAGLRELASIRAHYDELIMQAKQAKTDKDYERLDEKRKEIEKAKKEQDAILLDLKKEQLTRMVSITKQNNLLSAWQGGNKDYESLFVAMNYDSKGRFTGEYTAEDIDDFLDMMESYKEEPEAEEEISWSGGKPYRAIKDENGNVVKYEPIPGIVEKPEKPEEPKEEKPLSITEIAKLQEMYPDAGIDYGDTSPSATDKINNVSILKQGFTSEQARDIQTSNTAPDWFRQQAEQEYKASFLPSKLNEMWLNFKNSILSNKATSSGITASPSGQSALDKLKSELP